MKISAIRSDKVYSKIMNAPLDKKNDIYRYELMKPFEKKWACYSVPMKALTPNGYDVIMASEMLGHIAPTAVDQKQQNNIKLISDNTLWEKCELSIQQSLNCFVEHGVNLPIKEYAFTILLANAKNPYIILNDGYCGDGGIPGYIFSWLLPNEYTLSHLHVALAHETNHNVRFQFIKWKNDITLGEMIVNEGLAENFATFLYGEDKAGPWVTKTDIETLNEFATGAATSATLATSIGWAERIPNAVSGGGRIRCLTYNGGTLIGEKTVNFTATVPTSVVPTISAIDVAESADGIAEKFKAFVKTKSQLSVSISAAGAYKSTIKSYSTKIDGKTYTGKTFNSELIGTSGEITVSVTVTDTRGRTATKTTKINVLDYVSPTITTFSAVRGDSNGTPNEEGAFALINLNFSISPVNNLNDKEYKIEYKRHKDTAWTLLGTGNEYEVKTVLNGGNILNADYSYQMRLTVTDFFSRIETEIDDISSAFTLFDVNKGGKSIAFGGVSERDPDTKAIDFKMEIFDLFGTRINNGMAKYTGSGERAIDPNTTIDELILTDLNTPNGKFMYITTVFYVDKSETANRAQTAIPYNSNGSMYHRYFSGGVWSKWAKNINDNESKDYVVETGNNGQWYYRKWNSGYCELQFKGLIDFTPNQKIGSVFRSEVKELKTPFPLTVMKTSYIGIADPPCWANIVSMTGTYLTFYIYRGESYGKISNYVNVGITGFWK